MQQEPRSRRNASVLRFPLFYALDGEQEVRVFLNVGANVDNTGRADEFPRTYLVNTVFRQVFSAYPMNGCIKMRPCMLAGLKAVPIPGRSAVIIARDLPETELRSIGPL